MATDIRSSGGGSGGTATFNSLQQADPAWPDSVDEYGILDAEKALGNPPGPGYVLESDNLGNRQWVLKPTDGVSPPNVIVQYSKFQVVPGDFSTIYQAGDVYMIVSTDGGSTFSSPITIIGDTGPAGPAGNYNKYIFINATTQPTTPTVLDPTNGDTGSWFSYPPGGIGFTWMSIATVSGDGTTLVTTWSVPTRLSQPALEVEYSADGATGWSSTYDPNTHIYMRQSVDGGITWGDSIKIVGETGADGPFIDNIFRRNNTQPVTPTGDDPTVGQGWSDGPPDGDNALWISSAKKNSDGTLFAGASWSTPAKLSTGSLLVEYSPDGILGWDSTFTDGVDFYIRQSTDGGVTWSAAAKIVGEAGQNGSYTNFIFARSNVGTPSTPAGNDPTNGGAGPVWFDEPPVAVDNTYKLYMSKALFLDSVLQGSWSAPIQLEGENGVPGEDAKLLTMSATAQAFAYDKNSALVGPTDIVFDLNRQNLVAGTVWNVYDSTGAEVFSKLTSVSNSSATLTAANFATIANNTFVTVRATSEGLTDQITVHELLAGVDGTDTISVILSNESHTTSANSDGTGYSLATAGGQITVFEGITDVTDQCTFSIPGFATKNSLTIAVSNGIGTEGEYTLTDAGLDTWDTLEEIFTLRTTFGAAVVDKVYTISKAVAGAQGPAGATAKTVRLSSTSQVFAYDNSSGVPVLTSDSVIDLTFNRQNTIGATTWEAFDSADTAVAAAITAETDGTAQLSAADFETYRGAGNTIRIVATADGLSDEITFVRLLSGIDGEGSYVGWLTNEAHVVASAEDGTGYSLTGSGGTFEVYFGTTRETTNTTYSVVAPATKNGLTISISNAALSEGEYTLSGAAWTTTSETFTLRATTPGATTIDKTFTITKAPSGPTGPAGADGTNAKLLKLTSSSQVFSYDNSSGTPVLSSDGTITFTVSRQNVTGATTWQVFDAGDVRRDAAITGETDTSATLTAANFTTYLNGGNFLKVVAIADGVQDEITIVRLLSGIDGEGSYVGWLTNEAHVVASAPDGTGYSLVDAIGTFEVYFGTTRETENSTFAVVAPATKNGLTISVSNTGGSRGDYSLSGAAWTTSTETFTIRATTPGATTIDKTFVISKSIAGTDGAAGATAQTVRLSASAQIFGYDNSSGTPVLQTSDTITFGVDRQNITDNVVWTATDSLAASQNAIVTSKTNTGAVLLESAFDGLANNDFVTITATAGAFSDSITVVKLLSGSDGAVGTPGDPGQDGIVGFLTNESHTVAALEDGTGYSLTGSGGTFEIYEGITRVTESATFSVLAPATVSGLTMAISNTGGSRGDYSLSGAAWTADQQTFTLRAVYSGVTIDKVYTIAKSKTGTTGPTGPTGPGGTDGNVQVFRYWEGLTATVDNPAVLNPLNGGIAWFINPPSNPTEPVWMISSEQNFDKNALVSNWTTPVMLNVDYGDSRIANDALTAQNLTDAAGWATLPASGATVGANWTTNIAGRPTDNELLNINQIWSDVTGTGRPADNADVTAENIAAGFADQANYDLELVYTNTGTDVITVSGSLIERTTGDGWDAQAYSKDFVVGPFALQFSPLLANKAMMIGVNSDPATNASYTSIDYQVYFETDGTWQARFNGTNVFTGATYAAEDVWQIVSDGLQVKIYQNGTTVHTFNNTTQAPGPDTAYYFDCSLNTLGSIFKLISFGGGPSKLVDAAVQDGADRAVLGLTAAGVIQTAVPQAQGGTGLTSNATLLNSAITLSSSGTLSGAGGGTVNLANLAGTIDTNQIAADAITQALIAPGAIGVTEIADNSITTGMIQTNAVTASVIAAGTITATEIATNAITANEIAAGTITSANIAANTIVAGDIFAGTITATELAAGSIIAGKIAADAVAANNIIAGTITANEIATGTITANKIATGTITATQIAAGAITADLLSVSQLSAMAATMGEVTGGTFQTATSGKRAVMTSDSDNVLTIYNDLDVPTFYVDGSGNLNFSGELGAGTINSLSYFSQEVLNSLNPDFQATDSTGGTDSILNVDHIASTGIYQIYTLDGSPVLSGPDYSPLLTCKFKDFRSYALQIGVPPTRVAPNYTFLFQRSTANGAWVTISTQTISGTATQGSLAYTISGINYYSGGSIRFDEVVTFQDTVSSGTSVEYRVQIRRNSGDFLNPIMLEFTYAETGVSGLFGKTISTVAPVNGTDTPDIQGHVWYVV